MSANDERSRLVFELAGPVEHEIFTLTGPDRVVLDIENVRLRETLPAGAPVPSIIRGIRSAPRGDGDLRVVLDMAGKARPKSFLLQPNGEHGHRLVVDVINETAGSGGSGQPAEAAQPRRDLVIAIDPGHGGRDPGALGRNGTLEKDIVLAVARRLQRVLNDTPGFRAVLTREGDIYLDLRQRMERARKAEADLFISLHADAFRDARARGSSVYALSLNGATSEAARWLAERENAADLVGGVSLGDKDEMLASVLLDLSQTATLESSIDVGDEVLKELGGVNRLHKNSVQQAAFVVLKSPDIPSILVETAFISNPHEERQLRSASHQRDLAHAIRDGVVEYFKRQAPRNTRFYAEYVATNDS
jgi:N-acetylmuramoyl-L-alanine amidase